MNQEQDARKREKERGKKLGEVDEMRERRERNYFNSTRGGGEMREQEKGSP